MSEPPDSDRRDDTYVYVSDTVRTRKGRDGDWRVYQLSARDGVRRWTLVDVLGGDLEDVEVRYRRKT